QGWIALDYTTRVDGSKSASSSKKSSGMNIQEIQNGDFSSIAGTWKNGEGRTMVFNSDGSVSEDNGFTGGDGIVDRIQPENNYISGAIHSNKRNVPGGGIITFLPAGTHIKNDMNNNGDPSDTNRDRIWTGQSAGWEASDFFYRVD
ncbi:DUF6287 domain-containing protein, partial [Streptococcus sp.]